MKFINQQKKGENENKKDEIMSDNDNNNKDNIDISNIIQYESLLEKLLESIKHLVQKINIELDEEENTQEECEVFKNKKEIIKANKELKEIEIDNEKNKLDIQSFYQSWNFIKSLKSEEDNIFSEEDISQNEENNTIKYLLKQENFIPFQLSAKKIKFYRIMYKPFYLFLFI